MTSNQGKYKRTSFSRRHAHDVKIGPVNLGSDYPILVQSMVISSTLQIKNVVEECKSLFDAGAKMVRITAQTEQEALTLKDIVQQLKDDGYDGPLVADIHYEPGAAIIAAKYVDKVRINPGNFTDSKRLSSLILDATAYQAEIDRMTAAFRKFLQECKTNNTAIRVGCNHGSLSDRILTKYGDTPLGMAESVMEFLCVCKKEQFDNVVVSMKASDVRQMVYATRLVVKKMQEEGMSYPVHVGVTEAGEGEDARIKSAIGIGTLLAEGIGDTIRVSLTEPSVEEIPVARLLTQMAQTYKGEKLFEIPRLNPINAFSYQRIGSKACGEIGGLHKPIVVVESAHQNWAEKNPKPDFIFHETQGRLQNFEGSKHVEFLRLTTDEVERLELEDADLVLLLRSIKKNQYLDLKWACIVLKNKGVQNPIIFEYNENHDGFESMILHCSAKIGGLFVDGLGDGIFIRNKLFSSSEISQLAYGILQNVGVRITRNQYIACPSCGRTNFDLLKITKQVKEATKDYDGLKIAIMGCIVNGLGEMADADYAYVGAGKNQVNLYHNQKLIQRGISSESAVDSLIKLIDLNRGYKR